MNYKVLIKGFELQGAENCPVDKSKWKRKENKSEPIIDKKVFDLAQSLMQRDTRTAPAQKQVYTFSGYLKYAGLNTSRG